MRRPRRPATASSDRGGIAANEPRVIPPELAGGYARCRAVSRRHGTTYHWSARLLPAVARPHVHALYAFARRADDIVDEGVGVAVAARSAALDELGERFFADLAAGRSDDPLLAAVVHTVRTFDIDPALFRRFLRSMAMDLTTTSYPTWSALAEYMDGSAAAIGEMLLPILGPAEPDRARPHARALGQAFQLTNFLRDVGDDLDRGRQYLPAEDLDRFGVDLARREADPAFVELMRFEIARCRELYTAAAPGVGMLPPRSARCVGAAHRMYAAILTEIERRGHDVFAGRAVVPRPTRLAILGRALIAPMAGSFRSSPTGRSGW